MVVIRLYDFLPQSSILKELPRERLRYSSILISVINQHLIGGILSIFIDTLIGIILARVLFVCIFLFLLKQLTGGAIAV